MEGDLLVDVAGGHLRQDERLLVCLDEHVDLGKVQGVVVALERSGHWQVGAGLDHQHTIRVSACGTERVRRGAVVQRERDGAVLIRHAGLGHHHPRRHELEDPAELAKASRDQLDVGARGGVEALCRPEEARPVVHGGLGEHIEEPEDERTTERQVLEIVSGGERSQEGMWVGGAKPHADGVDGADECRRLLG